MFSFYDDSSLIAHSSPLSIADSFRMCGCVLVGQFILASNNLGLVHLLAYFIHDQLQLVNHFHFILIRQSSGQLVLSYQDFVLVLIAWLKVCTVDYTCLVRYSFSLQSLSILSCCCLTFDSCSFPVFMRFGPRSLASFSLAFNTISLYSRCPSSNALAN